MSTKIYVVKYIKDARRWEPRNVGIISTSDDSFASRFLGEQPDGRVFKTPVRNFVNDTDIYLDWIDYFRRTLTPGEDGISTIMRETDSNYWVVAAGEVWQGTTAPDAVVAEYFPKLVKAETDSDDDVIEPAVERLLTEAGIAESKALKREVEVPSTIERQDGKLVLHRYHYYWENGQKLVGERLSLKRADWTRGQLWKFEHTPRDITKVAFMTSRIRHPDLEAELDKTPSLERIDVEAKGALKRILAIFNV